MDKLLNGFAGRGDQYRDSLKRMIQDRLPGHTDISGNFICPGHDGANFSNRCLVIKCVVEGERPRHWPKSTKAATAAWSKITPWPMSGHFTSSLQIEQTLSMICDMIADKKWDMLDRNLEPFVNGYVRTLESEMATKSVGADPNKVLAHLSKAEGRGPAMWAGVKEYLEKDGKISKAKFLEWGEHNPGSMNSKDFARFISDVVAKDMVYLLGKDHEACVSMCMQGIREKTFGGADAVSERKVSDNMLYNQY